MSIYFYLSIVTIIVGILVSLFRLKTPVNPIVAFAGPWFIVLVYSVSLHGIPIASSETYQLIFYGLLSFVSGTLVLDIFQQKITIKQKKAELNKGITYFLIIIVCAFYTKNLLFFYSRGIFGLDQIISTIQAGSGPSNSPILRDWIVLPSQYAIGASVISSWVLGDRDKKILLATVLMFLLAGLSTGSKTTMILLLIFFMVGIILTGEISFDFKKSITILAIIASIYFVLLIVASSRNQVENDLTKYEMGISPRMLQIWIDRLKGTNLVGYGEASLAGFLQPIVLTLSKIFPFLDFSHFAQVYDWTISTDTTWVYPGTYIPANAYVSAFYFFYVDFRVVGIITFSFIAGVFATVFHNLARKQNTGICLSIYMVVFYQLLYSFVRSNFVVIRWAYTFVYIFLLWRKCSKKEVLFNPL